MNVTETATAEKIELASDGRGILISGVAPDLLRQSPANAHTQNVIAHTSKAVAATEPASRQSDAVSVTGFALPDDLSREVYCILGMPIDAIGMHAALRRIKSAAGGRTPFLISTPNLNFLVHSQLDRDFRESLILSDLCTADGMPIIWIAWLTGIPIKERIAGSDIFDALKAKNNSARPLKIFLFGGAEGVATAASRALNAQPGGLYCVGSFYPGFGSVDGMSRDGIIDDINSSGADFLVASLGAQKGQLWLRGNHHRLAIPLRAHLGASVNFQAGTVRRAPLTMRKLGLEWLWRIQEEPYLWRRYWNDGRVLLRLLFTHVFPLAFLTWWTRLKYERLGEDLIITRVHNHESITLSLSGPANARYVDKAIAAFKIAIATNKRITLDFSNTRTIDARFLGLLLMLKKKLNNTGAGATFVGLSPALEKIFRLSKLDYVLPEARHGRHFAVDPDK
jgi:N-acetylglucosaminyldiphosphoundecaprenol N-acetyl-beta-D-mannosaminyltransferase